MVPFLFFDLSDLFFFRTLFQRFPMAAIGVRGRDLAGVGVLKDADEVRFSGFHSSLSKSMRATRFNPSPKAVTLCAIRYSDIARRVRQRSASDRDDRATANICLRRGSRRPAERTRNPDDRQRPP